MENENDIDQLFKQGLSEPEIPFNELDWEKMERKLDAQPKKRLIAPVWMYTASGIAAALAVFLTWILLSPQPIEKTNQVLTKTKNQPKSVTNKPVTNKPVTSQPITSSPLPSLKDPLNEGLAVKQPGVSPSAVTINPGGTAGIKNTVGTIKNTVGTDPLLASVSGNNHAAGSAEHAAATGNENNNKPVEVPQVKTNPNEGVAKANQPGKTNLNEGIAKAGNQPGKTNQPLAAESDSAMLARKANALAKSKDPFGSIDRKEVEKAVQKKMENALQQQHNLILSALAAPDISTAKSSKPSKVSSNLGMTATYALTSKMSLTSGAVYSKKYYNYDGNNSSGQPWEVDADCNVLDIPLNFNYKVMNKKRLSVSINTGLSSYFMLKEKYQFITGQEGAQKVSNLEIDNQNQHIFGIANVSVSFDHKISDNVSVGVQPFAKLPLTGIGYNDANLKSAGVSFSLNIGLFPTKKPGKYAGVRYSSMK